MGTNLIKKPKRAIPSEGKKMFFFLLQRRPATGTAAPEAVEPPAVEIGKPGRLRQPELLLLRGGSRGAGGLCQHRLRWGPSPPTSLPPQGLHPVQEERGWGDPEPGVSVPPRSQALARAAAGHGVPELTPWGADAWLTVPRRVVVPHEATGCNVELRG